VGNPAESRKTRSGTAREHRENVAQADESYCSTSRSAREESLAMAVYKRGRVWWYRFTWNGEPIRESTKQTNKCVAETIESAHKTRLATGEVGIREKKPTPTLRCFIQRDFLPFVRSTFESKPKTYENGAKNLCAYDKLAGAPLDEITSEAIGGYVAKRRQARLKDASINRELQALRRMFTLAQEWGKVERSLPKVRILPGEDHRDRVLTTEEERFSAKH
jgi:hypothetical protein